MTKKFLLLLCIITISGCHGDYAEIDEQYRFVEGGIAIVTHRVHDYECIRDIIPKNVMDYAQDKHYIVVYQEAWSDDDMRQTMIDDLPKEKQDSLEQKFVLMDSIKYCYWIIRKKDSHVYGPMTKTDYQKQCHQLKINLELKTNKGWINWF